MSEVQIYWPATAYAEELDFWVREMRRRTTGKAASTFPIEQFEALCRQAREKIDAYQQSVEPERAEMGRELLGLMRQLSALVSEVSITRISVL